jgi:hypothetical protein
MSEEELQKKMEFIIEQQAQFAANQGKAEERITRLENIVVKLYEDTEVKISKLSEDTDAKINALVDAQMKTESNMAELTERLNAFITVVERYVSEARNGKSQD